MNATLPYYDNLPADDDGKVGYTTCADGTILVGAYTIVDDADSDYVTVTGNGAGFFIEDLTEAIRFCQMLTTTERGM